MLTVIDRLGLPFHRFYLFSVKVVSGSLSPAEFYAGLVQRFSERDGMYFLPEYVAEYDKKRMTVREVLPNSSSSTNPRPYNGSNSSLSRSLRPSRNSTRSSSRRIGGWQKLEKPLELSELLEQNFLRYDGKGEVPNQIHSYLSTYFKELRNLPKDDEGLRAKGKDRRYVPDPNKVGDLEKLRERSLI